MEKFFITGGSGFIGTNVVSLLLKNNIPVQSYDIATPKNSKHFDFFIRGSLLDIDRLEKAVREFEPTHVIHLGARTDLDSDNVDDYSENIVGVENIVKVCDRVPTVKRVVFASSRLVCGIGYNPVDYDDYCPTTAYGKSKVEGEKIVKALDDRLWDWCIVRPTSIWGPWFGVPYRNFFDLVRLGKYIHPSGVRVFKSFGYVENVVYELMSLARAEHSAIHRKCFYVGDFSDIEVYDFSEKIAAEFKVRSPIEVPFFVLNIAAKIGDFLKWVGVGFPLTTFRLNNLITPMKHNFNDLREVVGDLPYSVEYGVKKTVRWIEGVEIE